MLLGLAILTSCASTRPFAGESARVDEAASQDEDLVLDSAILANIDYGLSAEDEASLAAKAMAGDAEAAVRLSERFFHDLSTGEHAFMAEALEWALIGAENGSHDAEFMAYSVLSKSPDRLLQLRALFWLERAAEGDHEHAPAVLHACPTVDAIRKSGTPCFGPGSGE